MKRLQTLIIVVAAAIASAFAQPRISVYDSLRTYFHVEPCCAMTLDNCLKRKPECEIAPRLAAFLNFYDSVGSVNEERLRREGRYNEEERAKWEERVVTNMVNRSQSLAGTGGAPGGAGERVVIDTAGWPVTGDPKAPVTVTVYFMGGCPMCKTNFRALAHEMTAGSLKGKAKMVSKSFVSNPVNDILIASHGMGRFTDMMIALAEKGGRVDEATLYGIAASLKMDTLKLKSLANDPNLKKRTEASHKEGEKNQVKYVPSYFINGRRYGSALEARWVVDAVDYAHKHWK